MEIKFAKDYGFCMGVNRAVNMIESLLSDYPDRNIVTIGPLIHNPWFIQRLEDRGVFSVGVNDDFPSSTIAVIRTHGLPPGDIDSLKKRGIEVIDATCPRVSFSQKIISSHSMPVIIAGDPDHGEVVSLCGFADDYRVVQNAEQASAIHLDQAILIAQTTISLEEFETISSILKENVNELIIKNTICHATAKRQQAIKDLIGEVDAMLIIGGLGSANTRRLYHIAQQSSLPSWQIEGPESIPSDITQYKRLGISAGASTPGDLIDAVVERLNEMSESV